MEYTVYSTIQSAAAAAIAWWCWLAVLCVLVLFIDRPPSTARRPSDVVAVLCTGLSGRQCALSHRLPLSALYNVDIIKAAGIEGWLCTAHRPTERGTEVKHKWNDDDDEHKCHARHQREYTVCCCCCSNEATIIIIIQFHPSPVRLSLLCCCCQPASQPTSPTTQHTEQQQHHQQPTAKQQRVKKNEAKTSTIIIFHRKRFDALLCQDTTTTRPDVGRFLALPYHVKQQRRTKEAMVFNTKNRLCREREEDFERNETKRANEEPRSFVCCLPKVGKKGNAYG